MSVFDRFLLIYLLKFHSFCKKLYFWYENSKYLLLRLKISLDFGAKIQINIKVNFLLKLDRLLESFIHNLLGYPIISKNYRLLFENQFVNKYLCKKNSNAIINLVKLRSKNLMSSDKTASKDVELLETMH